MQVVSAAHLAAVICWLRDEQAGERGEPVEVLESGAGVAPAATAEASDSGPRDLADVVGQPVARRAAEICAAGGHHMLLTGPPGVGKPILEIKHCSSGDPLNCAEPSCAHDGCVGASPGRPGAVPG